MYRNVPLPRTSLSSLTVPVGVPRSGESWYVPGAVIVWTSPGFSHPNCPTMNAGLWKVLAPPITVNGSPYSV